MIPPELQKFWVPREAWGAKAPHDPNGYRAQFPKFIVIHHTFIPSAKSFRGAETIRGIQNYHMSSPGAGGPKDGPWNDIGYHAIISPSGGQVFEGRPWLVRGAHAGDHVGGLPVLFGNSGSIAVACAGNYDEEIPDLEMVRTLKGYLSWLMSEHRIPWSRVVGHFQAPSSKTCPGKHLAALLPFSSAWAERFHR
jgi:hypothetical protein